MYLLDKTSFSPIFKEYENLQNDNLSYNLKEKILELCEKLEKEINDHKDDTFILDIYNAYELNDKKDLEEIYKRKVLKNITKERLLKNIQKVRDKYNLVEIDKDITNDLLREQIRIFFNIGITKIKLGAALTDGNCNEILLEESIKGYAISIGYNNMRDTFEYFSFIIPENMKVLIKYIKKEQPICDSEYIEISLIEK